MKDVYGKSELNANVCDDEKMRLSLADSSEEGKMVPLF